MLFKLIILFLSLFPNLLIGYVFLNKDSIIENQRKALFEAVSSQLNEQIVKQVGEVKDQMNKLFPDTIKPEIDLQNKKTLRSIPSKTGPAVPF